MQAGMKKKFEGDRLAALRWAILEEKRRTVRNIVSKVLVIKGKNKEKLIIPSYLLPFPRTLLIWYTILKA